MTIVIPMSGPGTRFKNAGYRPPKPLIKIEGKQAIKHVLETFPGEKNIVFIPSLEQLGVSNMADILQTFRADAKVIAIKSHEQGPVHTIKLAYNAIPDDQETFVCYCNLSGQWNLQDFKKRVQATNADAAVISVSGFHPFLRNSKGFGHLKTDTNDNLLEISETYRGDAFNRFSVGVYWFKTGALMKKYFDELITKKVLWTNELACGAAFNLLLRDNKKVIVYDMPRVLQWAVPEDLEEFEAWSRFFAQICGKTDYKLKTEIPPARESLVKIASLKSTNPQMFAYWHAFLSQVSWHPYQQAE